MGECKGLLWIDIERAKESAVRRVEAAWQGIEPGMLVEVRGTRDDSQRITLTAAVQGLREQGMRRVLTVEGGGRRIRVVVPKGDEFPDPATIVDATVSVSGVATTSYTTRGQFVMPTILLARASDMQVVQLPPAAAFAAPEIPLNRLGRLLPDIDVRHRIRTRGTVSYASGNRLLSR